MAKGHYAQIFKEVFVAILLMFVVDQVYWLTKPNLSWWQCLWNPASCLTNAVLDQVFLIISTIAQPAVVGLTFVIWIILKAAKK